MPCYEVRDPIDILHVQSQVRAFAEQLGFSRHACLELAIVATELTTNILKYGLPGQIMAEALAENGRTGLCLTAVDSGPAFRNFESALKDGWDDDGPIDPIRMLKRKGIGGGLGAITRFSDSFDVETLARGKRLVVRRFLK